MRSPAAPSRPGPPLVVSLLLVLLGPCWVLGAGWLLLVGMFSAAPFFGEQPTPAEVATARDALLGAAAVLVGVPVLALAIAVRSRARVGTRLWGAGLVVGLVLAVLVVPWGTLAPDPAVTPAGPRHCQELSGGDTRCPGG